MSSLEEIRAERLKKRDMLHAAGMPAYAARSNETHTLTSALILFDELAGAETEITVAGRIMSLRRHGGSVFADLYDGTDELQIFIARDAVGEKEFDLFTEAIDQSDFIEATGTLFTTKRGAHALAATSWRVLTKALQAVPSEFYGIKDEEERLRKRYLDILLNADVRDMVEKRALLADHPHVPRGARFP
jgi:lysyl-tRNA synthetase class 2